MNSLICASLLVYDQVGELCFDDLNLGLYSRLQQWLLTVLIICILYVGSVVFESDGCQRLWDVVFDHTKQ